MAKDVERIEPWQLPAYLQKLQARGVAQVRWNKERLALEAALSRAAGLSETATVVLDGEQIYVAEPDHSADDTPRQGTVPIQIWPRRSA
jgi:hypothetical protein